MHALVLSRGHPIALNLCERIAFDKITYLLEGDSKLSNLSTLFHVDESNLCNEKSDYSFLAADNNEVNT